MLRAARSKVQHISRRCANDFWLQLCNHIQVCADTGNLKGIGPMQSRIAPLKSGTGDAIKDKSRQMERWVKHYSELYSRVNVVSEEALMPWRVCLSWMNLIASQHWKKSTGKAPGNDDVFHKV